MKKLGTSLKVIWGTREHKQIFKRNKGGNKDLPLPPGRASTLVLLALRAFTSCLLKHLCRVEQYQYHLDIALGPLLSNPYNIYQFIYICPFYAGTSKVASKTLRGQESSLIFRYQLRPLKEIWFYVDQYTLFQNGRWFMRIQIGPCCLVQDKIFFWILSLRTRHQGLIWIKTKEILNGGHFGIRCIRETKFS